MSETTTVKFIAAIIMTLVCLMIGVNELQDYLLDNYERITPCEGNFICKYVLP